MRLFGRNDILLLGGLGAALFILFSGALGRILDLAHRVDNIHGVRLLPALVVLAAVFVFHQHRKRQEAWAEAMAAATDARQADARATDMERLVAFGRTLAKALDFDAIRDAAAEHLPTLVTDRASWAMVRTSVGAQLRPLTSSTESPGDVRFPMVVGDDPIGILGVAPEPPLTEDQRSVLTAAAAMLAVSLKNAELFREVRENSVRDSLTGCVNRKHAIEVMDAELRRARRSGLPLSVLMFDLDRFKTINDRWGHLCGDAVLATVGQRMNAVLRGSDLKCRYGGEEFLVLLPDTPMDGARHVAETLRRELELHPVTWNDETVEVTASFGLTSVIPGETDLLAVIGRADAALYRAKQAGRNCLRVSEPEAAVLSDPQFT
jgi:diguanylate cyclase (GGDEF)-like protein